MVKVVDYIKTKNLAGRNLRVYLRKGNSFEFYAMETGDNWMRGIDSSGLDLHIDDEDIDYIIDGIKRGKCE